MFIAALFTIAKIRNRWMDKDVDIWNIWNVIQLRKRMNFLPFATIWMDLENIIFSEISQSEKAKCQILLFTLGI